MSGISTHTCMEANAFADTHDTSVILMRRLLPRRLYPGKARVGQDLTTLRYREDVAVLDGVDYYWIPSMVRAIFFLARHRPERMVFQWWSGTVLHSFLVLAAVGRLLGAEIVLEFHETLDTAESAYPLVMKYVRLMSPALIGMARAGAVHSEVDVEAIRHRFPGMRGKPIAVAPLGSYVTGVDPQTPAVSTDSTCRLLYFGTIRPYKGVEKLIEAYDRLGTDEARCMPLTIVGETWENWTLPAQLIERSRHREHITFVNTYVTDEQAAGYFRAADALVLPYLRSSASGPLHMAMSFGLPVAVTAVGGLVQAASEYTGARLVQPGSIDDLLAALRDLPGLRGPHADPHSWNKTLAQLESLFTPGDAEVAA